MRRGGAVTPLQTCLLGCDPDLGFGAGKQSHTRPRSFFWTHTHTHARTVTPAHALPLADADMRDTCAHTPFLPWSVAAHIMRPSVPVHQN